LEKVKKSQENAFTPPSSSFLKYKQEKTLGHPEMVPEIRWDRNF
jgi:hypothetical protein